MRIDAHHHLWSLARGDYGWLTSELAPIYRDFGLPDLAPHLAAAGIEGAILVQAAPTEAETLYLLDIAETTELVRGVVGWTDFDAADGAARIDALAARKLLVGLRPMVQDIDDDDWLLGAALTPLLAAMAQNRLVFDALVLPRHLAAAERAEGSVETLPVAELPALIWDSRNLHAQRAAAHAPGPLIPVTGANHFTILDELRHKDGILLKAARDLVGGHA